MFTIDYVTHDVRKVFQLLFSTSSFSAFSYLRFTTLPSFLLLYTTFTFRMSFALGLPVFTLPKKINRSWTCRPFGWHTHYWSWPLLCAFWLEPWFFTRAKRIISKPAFLLDGNSPVKAYWNSLEHTPASQAVGNSLVPLVLLE